MTVQPLSLFDAPSAPLPVRSNDPATSVAAARVLPLRARQAECMCALRYLAVAATADEVRACIGSLLLLQRERGEVASRLAELERMAPPLVCKRGVRRNHKGRNVATWVLTQAGRGWGET